MTQAVQFDVEVLVQKRYDRWAATTAPFAITMYGATEAAARDRAFNALAQLLNLHREEVDSFLERRGVPHRTVEANSLSRRTPPRTWHRATRYTNQLEHVLA